MEITSNSSTMASPGFEPYCDEYNYGIRTISGFNAPNISDHNYTGAPSMVFYASTTLLDHETVSRKRSQPGSFIPSEEVSNLVLYCIVFVLAVLGNVLVIITLMANRRMRTVASCFLLSLSVSDLLLTIICMPISLTGRILKKFIFGTVMCKAMSFLMVVSVSVSTFTMLAISVERYYAICRPLRSRAWQTVSHAYKVIAGVWLVSCLIGVPYFFVTKIVIVPLIDYEICTDSCRTMFTKEGTQAWYLFLLVTLFCIPGIMMTVAYILVSCRIWKEFQVKSKQPRGDAATDEYNDANDGLYIAPKANRKSFRNIRNSVKKLVSRELSGAWNETPGPSPDKTSSTLLAGSPEEPVYCPRSHLHCGPRDTSQQRKKFKNRMDSRTFSPADRLKAKKKVVRMLIVIVILFFVCWTPLFIVNAWRAFDPETATKKLDGYIEIIQLMSYVSTCVNPLVYCFMNKQFRDGFLRACFYCCVPRFREKPGTTRGMR